MRLRRVEDEQPPEDEPDEGGGPGDVEGALPAEPVDEDAAQRVRDDFAHHCAWRLEVLRFLFILDSNPDSESPKS